MRVASIFSSTPGSLFGAAYKIQQLAQVKVKNKFKKVSSNLSCIAMVLRRRRGRTTEGLDGIDDASDICPVEIIARKSSMWRFMKETTLPC
jgi:hypothetical protein